MLNEVSNAFDELPNDAYIREKYILGAANKSVADIPKKKHCNKRIIKKGSGRKQTAAYKQFATCNTSLSQHMETLGQSRRCAAACQIISWSSGMAGR